MNGQGDKCQVKKKTTPPSLPSGGPSVISCRDSGFPLAFRPLTNLQTHPPVTYRSGVSRSIQADDSKRACADYLPSLICTAELGKGKDDLIPVFQEWRILFSALTKEQTKETGFTCNRRGCVRQQGDLSGKEAEGPGVSYSRALPGDLQSKIYFLWQAHSGVVPGWDASLEAGKRTPATFEGWVRPSESRRN